MILFFILFLWWIGPMVPSLEVPCNTNDNNNNLRFYAQSTIAVISGRTNTNEQIVLFKLLQEQLLYHVDMYEWCVLWLQMYELFLCIYILITVYHYQYPFFSSFFPTDFAKGTDYRRRLAVCENVLPTLLRKVFINSNRKTDDQNTQLRVHG